MNVVDFIITEKQTLSSLNDTTYLNDFSEKINENIQAKVHDLEIG